MACMTNVLDLPAHPPRGPSGEINVEQLQREYEWEHVSYDFYTSKITIGYGNGYRRVPDANFEDYKTAVLKGAT
jgi:hypothetical protein